MAFISAATGIMAAAIITTAIATITAVIITTTDILIAMDTGIAAVAGIDIMAADMGITEEARRCRPSEAPDTAKVGEELCQSSWASHRGDEGGCIALSGPLVRRQGE